MELDGVTRIFQAAAGFQRTEITEVYPQQRVSVAGKEAGAVLKRTDYCGYQFLGSYYARRFARGYNMICLADDSRKSDLTIVGPGKAKAIVLFNR